MKIPLIARKIILPSLVSILFLFNSCEDISNDYNYNEPSGYNIIDRDPTWSPNGNTLAYVHGDTNFTLAGIYLVDTSGNNKRLFLNLPYSNSVEFSPNGEWLLINKGNIIYKIKNNNDSLTQLTFEGNNYFPTWSIDGEWIYYESDLNSPSGINGIWKMKKDGTNKIRIIYNAYTGTINMVRQINDTNKLITQHFITGTGGAPEITLFDIRDYTYHRLTNDNDWDMYPNISPDGNKVIFTKQAYSFQIYSVKTDGTELTKLTDTQGYTSDFSPDGKCIVYCDSRPGNGRLWIKNLETGFKKQITF